MTPLEQQLRDRLDTVREEVARAASRAGRDPSGVTLVAVTKSAPPEVFPLLAAAGVRDVGESRVQAGAERRARGALGLRWHLVGHLQSNKAGRALESFQCFHGIDSLALLLRLDAAAADRAHAPAVLLQVNVSGEASKHGLPPDELPALLDAAAGLRHVQLAGLMTMAPEADDSQAARVHFRALARLRDRCARPADGLPLRELSMGMSGDFAVAIEEGATLVRVGRRLFDGLPWMAPEPPRRARAGLPLLLAGLLAMGAATGALSAQSSVAGPGLADDVVPAAIDAAVSSPDDPFVYGIPELAKGVVLVGEQGTGSGRCVVDVGDVTGDGAADFATGFAPGSTSRTLQVRDGRSGAVLWSVAPDGGGFRGLRTLAVHGGALFTAVSSEHARVERRDPATGATAWTVDLSPGGLGTPANLLALQPCGDVNRDGIDDLLVAGGRGVDALLLLSGRDGATLWTHAAGDAVCDVTTTADLDGDGVPDVLCCGGNAVPFAALLSGATGATLWTVGLPGTGSALLPLPDISADGRPDVAVGAFAAPGPCLFALSGADGALLWTSDYAVHAVTSLVPMNDLDGDGLPDFAVGGLDNAATGVISRNGLFQWRTEGSTVNGGSMLCMAPIGDVNGNGAQDLCTASLDKHIYIVDGKKGYFLGVQDMRSRGIATAGLADGDGDGRMEMVAAGLSTLFVLGGNSGIAAGPVCYLAPPQQLSQEFVIYAYAYSGLPLVLLGAPAQGQLKLPGYTGQFGLSLQSFQLIFMGTAPGSGLSGYVLPSLPRVAIGHTLYFQAVTLTAPGHGAFSNVASFIVPP